MLPHAASFEITVHRIQIQKNGVAFKVQVDPLLIIQISETFPSSITHQSFCGRSKKPFPGTMSIAGNGCTKTAKEFSVIAQYMKTWNSPKA